MLLSPISCLKPVSMKMSEALTEDTFPQRTSQFLTGGSTLLPCGQWRKGAICNKHWLEPRYPCWLSTFSDYCQWLFQMFAGSRGSQNNAAWSLYPIANECKDTALKRKNKHLFLIYELYNLNLNKMNARRTPDWILKGWNSSTEMAMKSNTSKKKSIFHLKFEVLEVTTMIIILFGCETVFSSKQVT